MVGAFLFQDWGQVCEGEPTRTVLVLGWEKALFTLCALHSFSLRQIKPGRRFCVWWRNTPQYLRSLIGTRYSETLLCSIKFMRQAGWMGLNGDKILPSKGMISGVGVISRFWDSLPQSFLQVHISSSLFLFLKSRYWVHCHMAWPSHVPSWAQ